MAKNKADTRVESEAVRKLRKDIEALAKLKGTHVMVDRLKQELAARIEIEGSVA